ncbi:hypothetical protein [Nocardioides sp. URHA0020]|uniref:hypothetical protein n=1 Tax=Nocardioides sp. URHA0020 TaxID=1380392 RepID=UPI000AF1F9F1|nr:hypothetical protein [Nocardioides sp. URHA0020]
MTAPGAGFPVEDFLEAITNQLDRTQDSLRLKSVNRPLTYAIRDFSMELKVFVELGTDGRVVFRPSAADDTGASVVNIGFTTVNRTMIDENTVSLSAVRSPTLDELGLDDQERRQLEKLGVRNAEQLDQLKRTTGENTVARYSGLPVDRLRQALSHGRPRVRSVQAVPVAPVPATPVPVPPVAVPPDTEAPVAPPASPVAVADGPEIVRVPPRTRRIRLAGPRLDETTQRARLAGRPLGVRPVEGGVELDLGADAQPGDLELDLGEHGVVSMSLEFDPDDDVVPSDPWRTP